MPQFQSLCHGNSKLKVVSGICPRTQPELWAVPAAGSSRASWFFPWSFMELLPFLSFHFRSRLQERVPTRAGIPPNTWIRMEPQSPERALDQAPPVLLSSLSCFLTIPGSLGTGMCPELCLSHIPGSEAQTGREQPGKAAEFRLLDPSCFPNSSHCAVTSGGWE